MTVAFATTCWERDWRHILLHPTYLSQQQIANHNHAFDEKILIINNVDNLSEVLRAAEKKVAEGILTRIVVAEEKILDQFSLKRSDFEGDQAASPDAVYYNALAPLTAIASSSCDYLLYMMGDVRLEKPCRWIPQAVKLMEKRPLYKVATLRWNWGEWHRQQIAKTYRIPYEQAPNPSFEEVKRQAFQFDEDFYVSEERFSDQLFLCKRSDFLAPIFGELHDEAWHYPWGDTFEMRTYSGMKNRGWFQITYARGEYIHKNIE